MISSMQEWQCWQVHQEAVAAEVSIRIVVLALQTN